MFSLPSNLIKNQGKKRNSLGKKNDNIIQLFFESNKRVYYLKIEMTNSNSLLFTCNRKDDAISLYEYSKEISFEDLRELSKNFKTCDNIIEIFNTLDNTLTNHSHKSNPRIDHLEDSIVLFYITPLLSGKYEDINIILTKKERDVNTQFPILKKEYEKLRTRHDELKKEYNIIYNKLEKIFNVVKSKGNDEKKYEKIKNMFDD